MNEIKFSDLGLNETLLRSITDLGFEKPSEIQAEAIPVALAGFDLIGQAQTGTGKTAAFGCGIINNITDKNVLNAIILAPTRELAIQVHDELKRISKHDRLNILPIYGGEPMQHQIRELKRNVNIVVGTPGRVLDHIKRGTLVLDTVKFLVLDEADEMLNMGFVEDIEAILAKVPNERQTLLFSATMPGPIQKIAERFMIEPTVVKVKTKEMTSINIEQFYLEVQEKQKFDTLTRLLDIQSPELAIIFGRTKRRVDELSEALNLRGYSAEGIHGDLSQAKRMQVLRKFKEGTIDVLVATDVAARGLDISGVTHVYNFDIPQDPESYVHRVGRTGRAGKQGMAMTFINPREKSYLAIVEKTTKRKMERMEPPTLDQALEGQQKAVTERILQVVENEDLRYYMQTAEDLLKDKNPTELVAAVIKMLTKEPDTTPIKLSEERPLPMRKDKRDDRRKGGFSSRKSGSSSRTPRNEGGRREGGRGEGGRGGRSDGRSSERFDRKERSGDRSRSRQQDSRDRRSKE